LIIFKTNVIIDYLVRTW